MKRLLCFVVTLGCIVGLLSGCGEVPAAQNGSVLSSEPMSSQGGSNLPEQSALLSSAQSSLEDSSGGEEPSPSSQKQQGVNPDASQKEASTSPSPSVSKSQGQAAGGKNTASNPLAPTQDNTQAPPATTPDVPSQGGNNDHQEEPQNPETITITLSVECRAAREKGNRIAQKISDENGYIRTPVTMQLEKDATAYDALEQTGLVIVSEEGMFGQYVKSIQSLKEGAFGGQDGWKYEVNGVYPGISCSKYTLSDGDIVVWRYSLTA
ncbi:DUF4430 domain-containing protein [Solibaculum mannosilyticum]|uniref:DUF4430 domain-containing protein n=1 Tax=Solibaculum mannosilyticum TaxID=2780922 RepID=UPI0034B44370